MIGCIFVFVFFFVMTYLDYMKGVQKTKYVDWDVKTITAGDYTIEFDINEEFYKAFLDKYHEKSISIPEIMQLRLYIKDELEKRLDAMPGTGVDGAEGDARPI